MVTTAKRWIGGWTKVTVLSTGAFFMAMGVKVMFFPVPWYQFWG